MATDDERLVSIDTTKDAGEQLPVVARDEIVAMLGTRPDEAREALGAASRTDIDASAYQLHLQPEIAALEWRTTLAEAGVTAGEPYLEGEDFTADDVGKVALLLMNSATLQWWMTTVEAVDEDGTVTFADNAPSTKVPVRVYVGHNFNDVDGVDVLNDKLAEIHANPLLPRRVVLGGSGGYRGNFLDNPQDMFLEATHISGQAAYHLAATSSTTVLAQLPGSERDFLVHNPDPLTGWIDRCGYTDFSLWGPELNVIGVDEPTTGNGVFYGTADGQALSVGDGYRTGGMLARNFPENGYFCQGAVPLFFKENKAWNNGNVGFLYERYGGSTANVLSLENFSGDWNNNGLVEFRYLLPNDTVSLYNIKSESNTVPTDEEAEDYDERLAEFVGIHGAPNYQKRCITFRSCNNPVVNANVVSHIKVARAKDAPEALFNIVDGGSVRLTYTTCNVQLTGDEIGSTAAAVMINDEVRGVTVPRTVTSGYYGTPSGFQVNGNAAQPVWTSAVGGSTGSDGANTWAKICTLSPGSTPQTDASFTWQVMPANATIFEHAVIDVAVRTNASPNDPTASIKWASKQGTSDQLYTDSFKIVAGAFGTDFEVWMKKKINNCKFSIIELGRAFSTSGGWTVTYHDGAAWQSAEPTGAALNVFSANTPNIGTPSAGALPNCTGYPIATDLHAATSKATPVDADEIPLIDSAASNVLKKLTWANLKATVLAYLATVKVSAVSFLPGFTPTTTSGATTVLTVDSNEVQQFSGSSAQTLTLPTTGVVAGQSFRVINSGSGLITVNASGGAAVVGLSGSRAATLMALVATPTTAAHWAVLDFLVLGAGTAASAQALNLMQRDANANAFADAFISSKTPTTTSAGTLTMTIADTQVQELTGSTTHTVKLPTTSIVAGQQYTIINNSSGAVAVQSSGANSVASVAAGCMGIFAAQVDTPTTAANWKTIFNA